MSFYYNPQKILSYNALLNFIIGSRGVGKTYTVKKWCTEDFIKRHHQFVYLRRFKSELEPKNLKHFFSPFEDNHEFDDHGLKVNQSEFQVDLQTAGFAIPLSTAKILKSNEFNHVKNIIFDEFIIDKGTYHYLPNEVFEFLDIIETIARLRDIRVFLLGNSITSINPYFTFFKINLPKNCHFKTFKNGLIAVEMVQNPIYEKHKKASRFGQLVADTPYSNYAIENKWLRDNHSFIRKKSGNCRNFSILILNGEKYGIWRSTKEPELYISNDFDPKNPCVFAAELKDHNEKTMLIHARSSAWFKPVIEAYRSGLLFFESQNIKGNVTKLLEKCLTS